MKHSLPDIPGYALTRRLGRGGMASVYLGRPVHGGKEVAVKVMSSHLASDAHWAKRFIHEAQVIAELSHPGIVPVYDVGAHRGELYIVMAYLEGGSLKSRLRQGLSLSESVRVLVAVAAALDYAGEKGFVHRDIKPDNILFDELGRPVILDFGIVKNTGADRQQMTQTGVVIGTTAYMSPEQAQGKALDQRADLYSLGVLFYEMLTGEVPFRKDSDVETLLAHAQELPPPLPESLAGLQGLMDRLLAKSPSERFSRGRDLIDAVESLEQTLRTLVQRDQIARASDATQVHARSHTHDDTAITEIDAVEGGAGSSPITTEEELTRVLSSAKAVIRDHSKEARSRKARRLTAVIASAAVCVVAAVSWMAYTHFYVLPKEKFAAQARLDESQRQQALAIAELLDEAALLRERYPLDVNDGTDRAIELYRQVRQLDVQNTEAMSALEQMASEFIAKGFQAVAEGELERALDYRDYAQSLNAPRAQLAPLRAALSAAQASELEQSFVAKNVAGLVEQVESDLAASTGWSAPAQASLEHIRRVAPSHSDLARLEAELHQRSASVVQDNIRLGRFAAAQVVLDELGRHDAGYVDLELLRRDFASARRDRDQRMAEQALLGQVDTLLNTPPSASRNAQLWRAIQRAEQQVPGAVTLEEAQTRLLDEQRALIDEALENYDVSGAAVERDHFARYGASKAMLSEVDAALELGARHASEVERLLFDAEALMASTAPHVERRDQYRKAASHLAEAEGIQAGRPALLEAKRRLEQHYVAVVEDLRAPEQSALARGYLDDAAAFEWPSDRLLQLRLAISAQGEGAEQKPKRRVISGGF